jgi:hypothetical protein
VSKVTEKYDICVTLSRDDANARARAMVAMEAIVAPIIGPIRWVSRIHGTYVTDEEWSPQNRESALDEVVCMYPIRRSASDGAWTIAPVGNIEVWTFAIPSSAFAANRDLVLDAMWKMSTLGTPCIAGYEYSMAAVIISGTDVMLEAGTSRSLATHAVVLKGQRLRDWSVLVELGDRVLITRES